ncbi:aminoglycoside phosphotransferase family protein [Arthrobacter sp. H20]|uniref:aminoglycoside phosphotransferase family protein n=1 Tax=Arthrobacter sp. H20 TaxID=1267981 RepID=UPI0004B6DA6B|nr:aminoglycoside phosphotransferase family protein [Arthrobacter sp. H20]
MTSCSVAGPDPEAPGPGAETAQLRLLESDGVAEPIRLALATFGRRPVSWSVVQVHHRPGAGATGIYQVQVDAENGDQSTEFLCISTVNLPESTPATVQRRSADGTILTVWQHPNDPLLPGLPWACDAFQVGQALFTDSQRADPADNAAPVLATVSYRPLRRAVITADFRGERRYLKVLRGGQGAHLAERHRLLTDAGIPAPVLIDVPAQDVLAMHPAAGTPLAEQLMRDGAQALDPRTLVDLLQRLPAESMLLPEHQAWAVRVWDYAKGAAAALPEEKQRISALAEKVYRVVSSVDAGPRVPSHGDFYEANLLVAGDQVSGLLDVDALGPGHLVDDLACFIGHLAVLPALDSRYVHVPAALHRFLSVFDHQVHPAALRGRAAGVALTLVAGAKHRATAEDRTSWRSDALQRLAIAENLVEEAEALDS